MDNLETLKQWISESTNMVFFGGAGVSTESGIPDFRSVDGLYSQHFEYPPEEIISHSFFVIALNISSASIGRKCSLWDLSPILLIIPWLAGSGKVSFLP